MQALLLNKPALSLPLQFGPAGPLSSYAYLCGVISRICQQEGPHNGVSGT